MGGSEITSPEEEREGAGWAEGGEGKGRGGIHNSLLIYVCIHVIFPRKRGGERGGVC